MTEAINTEVLQPDSSGLARAAELIRRRQLVAFPTETVYGLGGNAKDDRAVARIFEAKERPSFNPLIVHMPSLAAARQVAVFDADAEALARAFWPGPLSLVLPIREDAALAPLVSAGLPTVALRVPDHPVAQALLEAAGVPIAAPSANPSGRISPTRPDHVLAGLSGRIAAVVDGGPCSVGLESTIIAPGNPPRLLRPGGLPTDAVAACLGRPVLNGTSGDEITSPGQMRSHYAPGASVRLGAIEARPGEVMLGFGDVSGDINLSPTGDLTEAAANLFHALRQLDRTGKPIAVAPVPLHGLGIAINDRLSRAAAPRP